VLSCDLVVASISARFGLPEVRIGVIPTCAALFRAPRAFPLNLARELILTGEPIDAGRAHAAGFVNALSEPGHAVERAMTLANQICASSPLSVQACLAAVNGLVGSDDEAGWTATTKALASLQGTQDSGEGIRAFFEKRPPVWTGR
jgi:enoyl-CoA hydratase/carnithine racemase